MALNKMEIYAGVVIVIVSFQVKLIWCTAVYTHWRLLQRVFRERLLPIKASKRHYLISIK